MFIPEILSVPVFSAMGSGAVPWPTSGAVLAWMLIAVFVGSALGLLREALRGTDRIRVANRRVVESHLAPGAPAHSCGDVA